MIAPELPGKTFGQAEKLAVHAALTVDPASATRRREEAEQNRARIALRRDPSGAASLSGYDLPADETLAAHASACARAAEYKDSGVFPGVRMDQLRALAYLDLMNGITATARIAAGQPPAGLGAPNEYGPDPSPAGPSCTDASPTDPTPSGGSPSDGGPDSDSPDRDDPGAGGSPIPPAPQSPPAAPSPQQPPRPADLIIPLSTLLGLAERPGEGHGFGPLDPGLCRSLAVTAANSPHTTLCVTVTNPDGIAIGHGCARPAHRGRPEHEGGTGNAAPGEGPPAPPGPVAVLPARINLTIQAAHLPELAEFTAKPGPWSFAPAAGPAPPGGYGTWQLTLPGGRLLLVKLDQVPTFGCDHRHESHAYQPNDTLRHLVQVRDYECTFPTCSRHARESDFEHARPYAQGGRTCGCNAGARSRQCHRVKQSPGWHVTQPAPGWHQWVTPSGRVYTQGPKHYPA
jgi:hypothetical protein